MENSCSQAFSPQSLECQGSLHNMRSPPQQQQHTTSSLAETYKSLVQECSEGLDLSLSPEKTLLKTLNVESPTRQPINKSQMNSIPDALDLSQLDMDNESAIAAITGMGITPIASVATSTSSAPSSSNTVSTSTAVSTVMTDYAVPTALTSHAVPPAMTSHAVPSVMTSHAVPPAMTSHAIPPAMTSHAVPPAMTSHAVPPAMTSHAVPSVMTSHAVPPAMTSHAVPPAMTSHAVPTVMTSHAVPTVMTSYLQPPTTYSLPDPPIIVLNGPNQSFNGNDPAGYFSVPPSAASTPHPRPAFMPEDTAFIVYPPLTTDPKPRRVKEKPNPRRSGRLRKLLPKPYQSEPLKVIHVKVLPNKIEETEEETDEGNDMELAKELPNLEDQINTVDANDEEKVIDDGEKVSKEEEKVANNGEKKSNDEKNEANDENNETNGEEKVANDEENVLNNEENMLNNEERVSNDEERVSNNEENVANDEERGASENIEQQTETLAEENVDALTTTSDKENVSNENVQKQDSTNKPNTSVASECEKEVITPRPTLRKNISRSTPRRNSHVRALSFNTPLKTIKSRKSNTSPKMPKIKFSPRSSKLSCVKRSSLFSPKNDKELSHLSEEEENVEENNAKNDQKEIDKEKIYNFLDDSQLSKIPIATRSPAPKLSSAWQEVNDIQITEKPVWDEKIRSFALGEFEDPAPPPKKRPQEKLIGTKNASCPSSKDDEKSLCGGKALQSKKGSFTPVKSLVETNKVQNRNPKNVLQKNTNSSSKISRRKTVENKTCSPLTKTNPRDPVSDSNRNSVRTEHIMEKENLTIVSDVQENVEDQVQKLLEPTDIQDKGEHENINTNNVLLEDLVVSSQSCFPPSNDEIRTESLHENNASNQIYDLNKSKVALEDKNNHISCTESMSSTVIQSNVVVLETPLKEYQVCHTKMFDLTTPLVKSIRQETSILEQDLLLTPSLPPTPQLNSSPKTISKTPCKTSGSSPIASSLQMLSNRGQDNGSSVNKNKKPELSPPKHMIGESDIEDGQRNSPTLNTQHIIKDNTSHENSEKRSFVSTSTDSSECEDHSQAPCLDFSTSKSKINSCKQNNKNNKPNRNRSRFYSTTESSDDETTAKVVLDTSSRKTKLSKVASLLLENERKNLNKKYKKTDVKKTVKTVNKKQKLHSPENASSGSVANERNKITTSRKKSVKQNVTCGKKLSVIKDKSPKMSFKSKENSVKQSTPENKRQQLQSVLLRQEQKMIFGDRIPSTSDSDSDTDIFEKKKSVTKTKSEKCPPKKKKRDHIKLSEDSSSESSSKNNLNSSKCVKLNTDNVSEISPNKKNAIPSLLHTTKSTNIDLNKTVPTKKCRIKNNPFSESFEIQRNNPKPCVDIPQKEISKIKDTSNEICSSSSIPINPCNISDGIVKELSSKNDSEENKKSKQQCGSPSKLATLKKDSELLNAIKTDDSSIGKVYPKNGMIIDQIFVSNKTCIQNSNSVELNKYNAKYESSETLNASEDVQKELPHTDSNEDENEICITSTSTSERTNFTAMLDQLDLNRRDTYQVDEGNVILSYSQIIQHYYYSPLNCGEIGQCENKETTQLNFGNTSLLDNGNKTKEQTVKRRIQLIPIENDKYEQKLQVDYDVAYHGGEKKIIVNRGNRRLSSETEILECSTSSLLSSDTGYGNKQSFNMLKNCLDSQEKDKTVISVNQQDTVEQSFDKFGGSSRIEINEMSSCFNKKEVTKESLVKIHENLKSVSENYPNRLGSNERVCRDSIVTSSKSRNHRSHHSREQTERERDNSRYEKESPSPLERRRDRDECGRYDRRDRTRYCERWRRESDKRNQPSHRYDRRGFSTDSEVNRRKSRRHFKSPAHDVETIEQLKKSLSRIEQNDLDRVDTIEESTKVTLQNEEKVDPRAAQILSYSDVEKNDSSRDGADSLMDFAVISKTKDKSRLPENLQKSSSASSVNQQDSTKSNKRKATNAFETSVASLVQKKLKLGEVEMKEAKSVLRHKMADMLNVLHPDTSTEAT
ncbi:repetitive organellar protein-like isoform X2 [Macrosteles quadrilineatus]|uniref:repetitive organellar protein-like isoform X2 n=1 Tax=Macrosteles quadrilineatus TaxID=74068 RepID=UPI0023E177B5|nr:repetitive organellar protein-like isoform X2 [Macrosteles quadrilineatus]